MLNKTRTHIDADDIQLMVRMGIPGSYIEGLLEENELRPPGSRRVPYTATSPGLSPSEVEILRAGGASGLCEEPSSGRISKRRMALSLIDECRALVEQCYDSATVASLLQTSAEEVRWLAGGETPTLYAFCLAGNETLHFPQWQFAGSGTIPGLRTVLAAVGTSVNPIAFSRLMLMKSTDLENGEECCSPRKWLAGGLDPLPVLIIARNLASD